MSLDQISQLVRQDPFACFRGIELLELREGYSRVAMTVGEHILSRCATAPSTAKSSR